MKTIVYTADEFDGIKEDTKFTLCKLTKEEIKKINKAKYAVVLDIRANGYGTKCGIWEQRKVNRKWQPSAGGNSSDQIAENYEKKEVLYWNAGDDESIFEWNWDILENTGSIETIMYEVIADINDCKIVRDEDGTEIIWKKATKITCEIPQGLIGTLFNLDPSKSAQIIEIFERYLGDYNFNDEVGKSIGRNWYTELDSSDLQSFENELEEYEIKAQKK